VTGEAGRIETTRQSRTSLCAEFTAHGRMTPMTDGVVVHHGLEGVVAFESEIAEPDKEGSALRYRGVDIDDLVGRVPFGRVWGLLVDGAYEPGLPPAEPFPIPVHSGDIRADVQSAIALTHSDPGYSLTHNWQAASFLLGGLVMVAVMLTHPLGDDSRRRRVRFWLDAGTVLVGAGVLGWCLIIERAAAPGGSAMVPQSLGITVSVETAGRISMSAGTLLVAGDGVWSDLSRMVGDT
jgi:hypothetical protein